MYFSSTIDCLFLNEYENRVKFFKILDISLSCFDEKANERIPSPNYVFSFSFSFLLVNLNAIEAKCIKRILDRSRL